MEKLLKTGVLFLFILLLTSGSCLLAASGTDLEHPGTAGGKHVVILGTSDIHGNIWGYSYEDNAETGNNGMARLNTYIRQVREETPDVFLVDAGDAIQGTIMTDAIYNKVPDEPHPVMAAMNAMGYDAMTLGNHEFDCGVPSMLKITGQADFPVLAANILDKNGNYLTGRGWTIAERGGVRLAIIGICTPFIPVWDGDREGVSDLQYESASEGVKKALEEIGDRADIIMVSAHLGQYGEFDGEKGSDSAMQILKDNPEVDILQTAHMHVTVNDTADGTVIGGVRNGGREICRFDVIVDEDGHITDQALKIIDMDGVEPDEKLRAIPLIREAHEKTIDFIWGGSDGGSVLGTTTASFQPENEIAGLPEGRLQDTAVIDLITGIMLENSGADVASCSLFKDTGDLPEGNINYGNIFDIYKYDNTLYRVTVTGAELKAYMELCAEGYNQWKEGDINISFDPEYPSYKCEMFSGVDYEINLSRPKGERIENVRFRGEPLRDDTTLTLAVNNYLYSSVLKTKGLVSKDSDWQSSCSIRDMIIEYFGKNSPVAPETDSNWRITGVDLNEGDPRREELIRCINEGLLPAPYDASYNLADYEELMTEAGASKDSSS